MADTLKETISQSLECPVCLSIFTDPKILSCSHTYCKGCLKNLFECSDNDQTIRCPVCRAETQVHNEDIGQLQTNLGLKNLIDDVKNRLPVCTNCKSEDQPNTVVYCQECGKYLCVTCQNTHSQWEDFISHTITSVSEISSGKITDRRYRKCRKHPKEYEECFCRNCRRFACFRCVVMEHNDEGHMITGGNDYESQHMKVIEDLKAKVEKKRSCFQGYVDFIEEKKEIVSNTQKQCTNEINKTYEEMVLMLQQQRRILVGEVNERADDVEKGLDEMKMSAQKHIIRLATIGDIITTKTNLPLDKDTLAAHDTLCEVLDEALKKKDPDYELSRKLSKKGEGLTYERKMGKDKINLGTIVDSSPVKNVVALRNKKSMVGMAVSLLIITYVVFSVLPSTLACMVLFTLYWKWH
ncbi:tripartite motif-containing protein 2-like [Lytechinus pictus]|uniref:tripartite motif-containing protein 2-like n=1 Tax=Lytechinus pictus TaxID=7653 RepID=UPI0030BA17B0